MHLKHCGKCLSLIKTKIGIQSFETWFKPIEPIKYFNDTLTLRVPNKFFYEWIEEHYIKLLDKIIHEVLGEKGRIEYLISSKSTIKNLQKKPNKILINKFLKDQNFNNLNNNYTFKSFIQGKCNSVARTAGERIYKNP